ncbi:Adenylyl cyclase-associated protein 1, partial [Chaetura pelagica]
ADMERLVERLEKAVERLETVCQGPGMCAEGSSKGMAQYVQAFDALLAGPVAEYLKISKEVGKEVQKHAEMVHVGLMSERALLVIASQHQQPPEVMGEAWVPGQLLHANVFLLLQAPKPGPYVKEMTDAAMFYTNRILKEYKDVDKKQVDWVKAYLSIWTELQAYIKEYHTTGLTWSKTVSAAAAGLPSTAPRPRLRVWSLCNCLSSFSAAPLPTPAPLQAAVTKDHLPQGERQELPQSSSQGQGEVQLGGSLRHVSDDMKTHKNPALKNQGGPVRSGPKPFTAPKPACNANPSQKTSPKAPALLELEGKKWRVENQENATDLVISDTELKQVAYVFKCTNSTLQIKGKINSITLDNCKKLGLVFDDVVGIVEIINSRDVKVQVLGKVPTISINKTDGCHVYLSKNSLDCEIVSAKSSEMNVLIPTEGEQFKTVWNGQKLVTTVTEIAG